MSHCSSSRIITISFLFLLVVVQGIEARELNKIVPEEDDVQTGVDKLYPHALGEFSRNAAEKTRDGQKHTHQSSHINNMDPSLQIFFNITDLKVGKTIPIYFRKREPSASPHFLPRKEADSIPFSTTQLEYLLKLFSFSKDSPQGKAIEYTLNQCQFEPLKGEIKFCATSLETMLDLAQKAFGKDTKVKILTTTHLIESKAKLQNYTILKDPKEVNAHKVLGCHPVPYPYAVFYCHSQEGGTKLFEVSLRGEDGDRVESIAICHMDTSQWNPDHVAFRVLGIQPGKEPVCHIFPADNLVWLPVGA